MNATFEHQMIESNYDPTWGNPLRPTAMIYPAEKPKPADLKRVDPKPADLRRADPNTTGDDHKVVADIAMMLKGVVEQKP